MANTRRRKTCGTAAVAVALLIALLALAGPANAYPSQYWYTNVPANMEGGALIWPLYSVDGQDTLIAITNTSIAVSQGTDPVAGVGFPVNSSGRWVLVHFTVRRPDNSAELANWPVCLSPGDVWTASFTKVGSSAVIDTTDLSDTKASLFPRTVPSLTGYIEAVSVDEGTTEARGCNGTPPSGFEGQYFNNSLFGEAFFVSTGSGLASGYNATALASFQDLSLPAVAQTIKDTFAPVPGVNSAQKRAFFALTHPGRVVTVGSLKSRWILDDLTGVDTLMVVTFPVHDAPGKTLKLKPTADFGFPGSDDCSNCSSFNFDIPATMTLHMRDDEECIATSSPRKVPIGKQVNVLSLSLLVAGVDGLNLLPACTPDTKAGWFNLMIDENENEIVDAVKGVNCTTDANGDVCSAAASPGTLQTWYVPAMLPIVGFSILQADGTGGTLLSGLLPWKWNAPANKYNCASAGGDLNHCTGVGIFPTP